MRETPRDNVIRYSGIYYTFASAAAGILALVAAGEIGEAAGMPWLGLAGQTLVVLVALSVVVGFYWLAWGGQAPRLAAALYAPANKVTYRWLVTVNNTVCRIRASVGPGRDLCGGTIHLRQGELERAVEALERHLRRSPKELAGLMCIMMALLKLGRYDEALRYLDAAVQQGASPDALALRCLALSVVGATEEALHDIEEATLRKPRNRFYPFYKALVLAEAGRADDALAVLKWTAGPKRFHLNWWPLSVALLTKGDTHGGAEAGSRVLPLLAAMRMVGPVPWDETPEAELLALMGRLDQAEKAAVRTMARNPGDPEALTIQALVRALRGQTEDALGVLERAAQSNPFFVVNAARQPAFAGLNGSPWFASLLERATRDWEDGLYAIRHRPGIAQSGV